MQNLHVQDMEQNVNMTNHSIDHMAEIETIKILKMLLEEDHVPKQIAKQACM